MRTSRTVRPLRATVRASRSILHRADAVASVADARATPRGRDHVEALGSGCEEGKTTGGSEEAIG